MEEPQLTPRQRSVLDEVCKGRSNKEIARALGMAEVTVKLHLTDIFKSIGVKTRAQAMVAYSKSPIEIKDPFKPLTELDILREFTNITFSNMDLAWADRVIKFGHAIEARIKERDFPSSS